MIVKIPEEYKGYFPLNEYDLTNNDRIKILLGASNTSKSLFFEILEKDNSNIYLWKPDFTKSENRATTVEQQLLKFLYNIPEEYDCILIDNIDDLDAKKINYIANRLEEDIRQKVYIATKRYEITHRFNAPCYRLDAGKYEYISNYEQFYSIIADTMSKFNDLEYERMTSTFSKIKEDLNKKQSQIDCIINEAWEYGKTISKLINNEIRIELEPKSEYDIEKEFVITIPRPCGCCYITFEDKIYLKDFELILLEELLKIVRTVERKIVEFDNSYENMYGIHFPMNAAMAIWMNPDKLFDMWLEEMKDQYNTEENS